MPAILETITGRRGRRDEQDDLDSVYGDLRITAPLGYPSNSVDQYIRDIGYGADDEDQNYHSLRKGSDPTDYSLTAKPAEHGRTHNAGRKASLQNTTSLHPAEKSRQRSRSQSGTVRERDARSDHRTRSSSSNRALRDRREYHGDDWRPNHRPERVESPAFNGATSPGEGLRRPVEDRTRLPLLRQEQTGSPQPQHHIKTDGQNKSASQRKVFQPAQSTMNAMLERSHSPAVTILSPVSETFGSEETNEVGFDARIAAGPVQPPSHLVLDQDDLVTSPGSLSDTFSPLRAQSQSPHNKVLTFRHGEQFVNPLAAHSTVQSRSYTPQQSAQTDQAMTTDKPLPACPVETSRSPSSENNAFMRPSGRTGPGLGSTAIMRPSSRNNHYQTYPQPQISQSRPHARSASLSHIMHSTSQPLATLAASSVRKGSHPEELHDIQPRSEASSAGSGFTSDTHSMRSTAGVRTPKDSPDHDRSRKLNMVSPEGPSWAHEQSGYLSSTSLMERPLGSPELGEYNSSSVGGNIYNELRSDLAYVARDLNEQTLASQRDRERKSSKLRIRARSASRHDRRSERQNSRDHGHNYTYREMDRSELKGNWGNTVFVPAYDLPSTRSRDREYADLKGEAEAVLPAQGKKGVSIVPDYEDLWG